MAILQLKKIDTVYFKGVENNQCYADLQKEMLVLSFDFYAQDRDEADSPIWSEKRRTCFRSYLLRKNICAIKLLRAVHKIDSDEIVRWTIKIENSGCEDHYIDYVKVGEAEQVLKRILSWWPEGIDPMDSQK